MDNKEMTAKYNNSQKATLLVAIVTAFVTTFTGSALNLSIPAMGEDFGVSASVIGWMVMAYMLTVAALSVPFGRLSDLTCRKTILVIGTLIFAACSLASVFAWNFVAMLIFRTLQGAGAAMVFSTNTATLISAFPASDRGKVLGYSVASTYIGLSAGPVLGGVLNHYFGWRSIFVVVSVIATVVFIIAAKALPKNKSEATGGGDALGNVLYISAIVLSLFGLSAFTTVPWALWTIPLGIVLAILFIRHEKRTSSPIVEVRLFSQNKPYALSNLATLLNYGATFAITYLLSIYLQVVMGYSSQTAGIILVLNTIIMAFLSPSMGKLSDRISPFKLSSLGMGICAIGLLMFAFLNEESSIVLIVAGLIVSGLGFAIFSSPNTNAVMSCVEKADYGVASSILATMRSLGHTFSMATITIMVGIFVGSDSLAQAEPYVLVKTIRTLFIIFTCVCVVGIFISLNRTGGKENKETP